MGSSHRKTNEELISNTRDLFNAGEFKELGLEVNTAFRDAIYSEVPTETEDGFALSVTEQLQIRADRIREAYKKLSEIIK